MFAWNFDDAWTLYICIGRAYIVEEVEEILS
jgi:hypothetical protein